MDIFDLNRTVIEDYERFARSFTKVKAADIRGRLDELYAGRRFWPEPLLQISPRFKPGGSVAELVQGGVLSPECADIFAAADLGDGTLALHCHQREAIVLAHQGRSFVVTTGTGSGKSLCFFIPIIDAVIRGRAAGEPTRTRAIVIYPMNALANSQFGELRKFLGEQSPLVTFARFTGQEGRAEREKIAANPPDILLTNFMMLELLMTRQDDIDRKVMANCEGLSFLVLDELHTYRGRQGADVAMLVRRVRERLIAPGDGLQCIGTSATMASGGTEEARARIVADVASTLFATAIGRADVIEETLARATDPSRTAEVVRADLGPAIEESVEHAFGGKTTDAEIVQHPLAIWIETTLGLNVRSDGKWERAKPMTLADATQALAEQSGATPDKAASAIRNCLLSASRTERDRTGRGADRPFFAFKLHQFISGAGKLHGTLEPQGQRRIVFDGQVFDPESENKRLYAIHFCRNCGQEFHPVSLRSEEGGRKVFARDIEAYPIVDVPDDGRVDEQFGFLMPEPTGEDFSFAGRPEDYPEA